MGPEVIILVIFTFSIISFIFLAAVPWKAYFIGLSAKYPISIFELIGMRIRKIDPIPIVNAGVIFRNSGMNIDVREIESHYLGGGHVENVAKAFAELKKVGIDTSFKQLAAIDLCGKDIMQSIEDCIQPVDFNSDYVSYKSLDGKDFRVSINITLQGNINKIIGGALNQALIDKIFDYIGQVISKRNSDTISRSLLEEEIMKESFSEGFSSDIKSLRINM